MFFNSVSLALPPPYCVFNQHLLKQTAVLKKWISFDSTFQILLFWVSRTKIGSYVRNLIQVFYNAPTVYLGLISRGSF